MKEEEIRPKKILDEYLRLSKEDGEKLQTRDFLEIVCPGCGYSDNSIQFKKNTYTYVKCPQCHTLYCNPRPNPKQLVQLYSDSKSSTFWSEVFFPTVSEVRKEKIFKPKAKQIFDFVSTKKTDLKSICDVGAGHGIFLEELSIHFPDIELFAVEPDKNSKKICEEKNIEVLSCMVEEAIDWKNKFDLVISSEVIEHTGDPYTFVESLYSLVAPEGLCLITGLGYEGYDILTLQDDSKAVSPPHHLNFLSKKGFEELFMRVGFKNVEVITPGKLDLDIVLNAEPYNEFAQAIKRRGEKAIQAFQNFLQEYQLSSHIWVLGRK